MTASRFVWYELMTDDVPAAAAFYSAVVGWTAADNREPLSTSFAEVELGVTAIAEELAAAR